jgi:choline dehydrogenase-like flavoprotein
VFARQASERPCNRADATPWFPGIRPVQEHLVNAVVCLLKTASRGWMLSRSNDPKEKPRIWLNLLAERADVETLIRGVRIARGVYRTKPTDPESVVDPQLRVRGIEGLRICDASIMPTVPVATPTPRQSWWERRQPTSSGTGICRANECNAIRGTNNG